MFHGRPAPAPCPSGWPITPTRRRRWSCSCSATRARMPFPRTSAPGSWPSPGRFPRATGCAPLSAALAPLSWEERGPNNIGGRTRVFAIDVANPDILIAGAVAGGDVEVGQRRGVLPGRSTHPSVPDPHHHGHRPGHAGGGQLSTLECRHRRIPRYPTNNDNAAGSLYRGTASTSQLDNGSSWTHPTSTSPQISTSPIRSTTAGISR